MSRDEILREFTVRNGIIRDPGKFEGEPLYAPHFWDLELDGGADDTEWGEEGEPSVSVFEVSPQDLIDFPELDGCTRVRVWEDSQGFVHTVTDVE